MDEVLAIYKTKATEYQTDEDVLSNFKENAKVLGLSPYQVWAIYFNKHVSSIMKAIKENPNDPESNLSESLQSRLTDIIAYSILLFALSKDQ